MTEKVFQPAKNRQAIEVSSNLVVAFFLAFLVSQPSFSYLRVEELELDIWIGGARDVHFLQFASL